MPKTIIAADLFCGAGGTSLGLYLACQELGLGLDLLAVNHWETAIETHTSNLSFATHLCEDIEAVDPKEAIPGGHMDILIASPECTHHSIARGGKPINDQLRTHAWAILRWAENLYVDTILVENVKEFQNWGPVGKNGRPLKAYKGKTYQAFLTAMRSLGYRVDARVLNCANYGDPTTRERLFIMARRGSRPIEWPMPTHSPGGETDLFGTTKPWRTAREIIDWSIPGKSIFQRKRPLAPNTMRRIAAGMKRFWGDAFILPPEGYYRGNAPKSLDDPLSTVTASRGAGHLVEPFLVMLRGTDEGQIRGSARDVDEPLPTVTAGGVHAGLVEPFILNMRGNDGYARGSSIDKPVPAVTTSPPLGLVEPFIISMEHRKPGPFIIPVNHGSDERVYPLDEPMRTITTVDAWALIEPFLVEYYGNGGARSVDDPLPTQTTKDKFALVMPIGDGHMLADIHFRMLLPHELARAQGFPDDYDFAGTRSDKVKQIGNAVPVNTAKALCLALLGG